MSKREERSSTVLLGDRRLAGNVVWSLLGLSAPLLVAIFAIPMLIDGMGLERFGVLAIVWMGVGYFSVLDLGVGRALTKLVAERLGAPNGADINSLTWTAIILLLALGVAGALLVWVLADPVVSLVLRIPANLHSETIHAFQVLALGLPAVVLNSALIGILEAHQRFAAVAAVRIPLGILTFMGPLATLAYTPSVAWATASLLLGRLIACGIYFCIVAAVQRQFARPRRPIAEDARSLLRFGGWLTVTNIVGPMMVYFDRFFIGAIASMTAVSHYVTSFEILSRLQLLPQAVSSVLFPAMTTAQASDSVRLLAIYNLGGQALYFLMLPLLGAAFLLGPEALALWLGNEFREHAGAVVQWLSLGWLVNALARMPLTALQSCGRPDLVAKSHALQLIPYVLLLWYLTSAHGIVGTAAAWYLRVLADTVILNWLAGRCVPVLGAATSRTQLLVLGTSLGFGLAWSIESILVRVALSLILCLVCGLVMAQLMRSILRGRVPHGS